MVGSQNLDDSISPSGDRLCGCGEMASFILTIQDINSVVIRTADICKDCYKAFDLADIFFVK